MTETKNPSGTAAAEASLAPGTAATAVVDIVVPVHNEQRALEPCIRHIRQHLDEFVPWRARITIAENASTDGTAAVARDLVRSIPGVRTIHLAAKRRGWALTRAWGGSDADILVYMDVDLSTDLGALLPLVAPLVSGHSDVAIGTRLAPGARVRRGPRREFISRSYDHRSHATVGARFSDAQCGFKAITRAAADELLPLIEDGEWFFDTELLLPAERSGMRIHEVPVDWVDDPDSRVDVTDTAMKDVRGLWRVGTGLARGRIRLPQRSSAWRSSASPRRSRGTCPATASVARAVTRSVASAAPEADDVMKA